MTGCKSVNFGIYGDIFGGIILQSSIHLSEEV
jgi:hypothetical protein